MPAERWLITGASGQLGSHVVRQLSLDDSVGALLALAGQREVGTPGVTVQRVALAAHDELRACVREFRPTYVVHLGSLTAVGECFNRPLDAAEINIGATRALAEAAADAGARLVYSSTDMVFDGEHAPYREDDPPHPLSHYGRTKAAAEGLLAAFEQTLVVRIPLLYGRPVSPRATTFTQQLDALARGEPLRLFTDEFRTPVWLADAARALIGLARRALTGVVHVAGSRRLSRFELIAECARLLGLSAAGLVPIARHDLPAAEPRPADLSLDGTRLAGQFPDLIPGPLRRTALA